MKYSIESMTCLVQCYVHIRKGIEIDIRVKNFKEIKQLETAYLIAKEWLSEYNFKIYG